MIQRKTYTYCKNLLATNLEELWHSTDIRGLVKSLRVQWTSHLQNQHFIFLLFRHFWSFHVEPAFAFTFWPFLLWQWHLVGFFQLFYNSYSKSSNDVYRLPASSVLAHTGPYVCSFVHHHFTPFAMTLTLIYFKGHIHKEIILLIWWHILWWQWWLFRRLSAW